MLMSMDVVVSKIHEFIPLIWTELVMFLFGASLYVFFTRGALTRNVSGKGSPGKVDETVKSKRQPDSLQDLSDALHCGNTEDAVECLSKVCADKTLSVPLQMAARLILALAKSTQPPVSISSLAWKPDVRAVEAAMAEASRRNDAGLCRRVGDVAEALGIPPSNRAFEYLAAAASDASSLRTLVNKMRDADVVFTKSLVLSVLGSCATVGEAGLASELITSVEVPNADPDVCAALIRVYAGSGLWDKACRIFEEVMVPAHLKPDPPLSELLMRTAVQAGRSDLMPKLSECLAGGEMAKQAKAIRACGKNGDLEGAVAVFNKLKSGNMTVIPIVYNCLIEACVQCGDTASAVRYLEEAKSNGVADVVGYNTAMKAQLAVGDNAAAERLLTEMTESGLSASLVTYHSLLNAKAQVGDCRDAWRLISQMRDANLAPTAVTYSIFLKGCTSSVDAVHVSRVVDLIDDTGVVMDEVLFASVVEACIRTGSLDLLAERTRQLPHGLTAPTYGSMIKAYGQSRDITQVWALWNLMLSREVRPTSITLGCMVEALVINGCTEEAWRLVQDLREDEDQMQLVNTVIYSTILKGFVLSKQHERVMALYDEMRSRGIAINNIAYNTMLNAFAQCGAMHRVPQLLEDMRSADPPAEPDIVTFSTIVKGYCASGNLDKGFELLQEVRKSKKLMPDEVIFNSLLDGCAREHRLDDALNLLEDMRKSGVAPSNYTLSILVKLLGRSRRLSQAFTTVETICAEHGFRANIQVYTCLMQACFHNRQPGKALALHDKMIREGCVPDRKTYVSLARGCIQLGAIDRAVDVVRCAYHLSSALKHARGPAPGVDAKCLEDLLTRLGPDSQTAQALSQEVRACSSGSQQTDYRSNQPRARGGSWRS
jgi:pentatricopeptide repeat protein